MNSDRLFNGLMAVTMGSALALGAALVASPHASADSHMVAQAGHGGHHGQGQRYGHGKQQGHHRCGMHGADGGQHGRGKGGLFKADWTTTLNDDQKARLDALRVAYVKDKMPMKARAQSIKTELAVLSLQEKADTATISTKLDELLLVKRAMMLRKYEYISSQRAVLDEDQRVSFDMDVMKRAGHRQKGKGRH